MTKPPENAVLIFLEKEGQVYKFEKLKVQKTVGADTEWCFSPTNLEGQAPYTTEHITYALEVCKTWNKK